MVPTMDETAVRDAGVSGEVPARVAISDADRLRAWNEMYRREGEWADLPIVPPDLSNRLDRHMWDAIGRMLQADREAQRNV